MPTYEYRRQDGTTFEVQQRITADALTICPTTGQPVRRVISGGTGLIFKGSGFYQTDYVSNSNGTEKEASEKTTSEPEAESKTTSDDSGGSGDSDSATASDDE